MTNEDERITYEEFMIMFRNAPRLAYMLYDKAEDEIERLNNLINKTTSYYYKTLSQYNNQNKKMPDEAVEMFNLLENNK